MILSPRFHLRMVRFCAGLLAFGAGAAAAQTPPTFQSGDWNGYAGLDAKQNNLSSRCTIQTQTPAPVRMAFGMTRDRMLEIWLDGAKWTLEAGASYPVSYAVDGDAMRDSTARALSKTIARIDVADSRTMFD